MEKTGDNEKGLAIICDESGSVQRIIDQNFELAEGAHLNGQFSEIIESADISRYRDFLSEINRNGFADNFRIRVKTRESIRENRFLGFTFNSKVIIISTFSESDMAFYLSHIIKILLEKERISSDSSKSVATNGDNISLSDSGLLDELSRINNEMVNTQRELYRKNLQLKRAETELEKSHIELDNALNERTVIFEKINKQLRQEIELRKEAEESIQSSEQQQRALAINIENSREVEQIRISLESHDTVGYLLSSLKSEISTLGKTYRNKEPEMIDVLQSMLRLVDQADETNRKVSSELRPRFIDKSGLTAAMEWQLNEFEERTGIKCNARLVEIDSRFDNKKATTVLRIFQEVLNNTARYSGAMSIEVLLTMSENKLILCIEDDGTAIQYKEPEEVNNLNIPWMKEHIKNIDGEFKISRREDGGTKVELVIPI